jgi:tetratricopeptide (TPR) repeat protein
VALRAENVKYYRGVLIVWLCLMAVLVGFIVFFDRYGEILVTRAWEADPANSYEVAVKYLEEGRLEEAADKFEMARRQAEQPDATWPAYKVRDIRVNLGRIYYELGQYDKALPLLQEVVANAPGLDHGIPLSYLADIYLKRGHEEKAAELFKATTEWNFGPTSVVAFFRLGELAAEKGEYEAALGYLDTAVTLDAGEALTREMWEQVAAIAHAATSMPEGEPIVVADELLGVSQYRLGRYEESIETLTTTLQEGRDTARVQYFLVKAYEAVGAAEKAQEHRSKLPHDRFVVLAREMVHTSGRPEENAWVLIRNGRFRHEVFLANRVEQVQVIARGTAANFVGAKMVVSLAGERLGEVETGDADFKRYTFPALVSKEHGLLEIEFTNDYRDPETGEDRNLYVEEVTLEYSP